VLHTDLDITEDLRPIMAAAISGDLIAVIIGNSCLKVFNLRREGAEVFHVQIDPIPMDSPPTGTPGYCIAISHNQKMVALGRDTCCIWHLDGNIKYVLAQETVARTNCLAFSNDGEHITAGFSNGSLREWFVTLGVQGREFFWPQDTLDQIRKVSVWSVVYAQTDDVIISTSAIDDLIKCYIWDRSGDCTFSYPVRNMAIGTTSANWLICADSDDAPWQIHDLHTGELKFQCSPRPREYTHLRILEEWHFFTASLVPISAISSDGKLAAFGSSVHLSIFIWDIHENTQLGELMGHSVKLTSVAFLESHGQSKYTLVSTSLDGTIRLWDIDQLFKPKENQHPMTFWGLYPKLDGGGWMGGVWIRNEKDECLFWLPDSCPIRHPLNTLVIGQCAELDMTNFVYGEEWTRCRGPNADNEPSEVTR
jgi:WD40 repeat protein